MHFSCRYLRAPFFNLFYFKPHTTSLYIHVESLADLLNKDRDENKRKGVKCFSISRGKVAHSFHREATFFKVSQTHRGNPFIPNGIFLFPLFLSPCVCTYVHTRVFHLCWRDPRGTSDAVLIIIKKKKLITIAKQSLNFLRRRRISGALSVLKCVQKQLSGEHRGGKVCACTTRWTTCFHDGPGTTRNCIKRGTTAQ